MGNNWPLHLAKNCKAEFPELDGFLSDYTDLTSNKENIFSFLQFLIISSNRIKDKTGFWNFTFSQFPNLFSSIYNNLRPLLIQKETFKSFYARYNICHLWYSLLYKVKLALICILFSFYSYVADNETISVESDLAKESAMIDSHLHDLTSGKHKILQGCSEHQSVMK